ncbi:hypothetical protein [uncultured Porphyromonas sp.]|uniref:hypothetical protein n=1 Tax=uncultured Porphyromonas sp. TaxID=159274 RepID=UPI00261F6762|nr:hypothetical protein [uncultured Porphyromonas sp.]
MKVDKESAFESALVGIGWQDGCTRLQRGREVEEDGEIGSVGWSKKNRGDGVVRSLERLGKAMRLEWLGGWGG